MSEKTYTPGLFVWRELMTPDVERARGFYGELFGWTFQDAPMGDFTYTLVKKGEPMIAGMMGMKDSPHPPHWMSYVSVDDVDAAAARASEAGGTVAVGPMDIPNVGRFAVVGDPDHAYLSLFKSAEGDPPAGGMPGAGTFCWETLATKDVEKAKAFYGTVVGWKVGPGPGGNPDIPVFASGDVQVADVQLAQGMPPSWMTYVVVENLEDANARATKLGGAIVVPLIEVPHVGRISLMRDPTGAHLGLFQPQMG